MKIVEADSLQRFQQSKHMEVEKKEKKIALALPVRDIFNFVLAAPSKTTKAGFDLASTLETIEGVN